MSRASTISLAIALFAGITASSAAAEDQALKFQLITHTVEINVVSVPRVEGHLLGVAHERGVAVFEDGRIADKVYVFSFDSKDGLGPFHGYSTYMFEDGSTISARFDGGVEAGTDGPLIRGEYSALTGTGQYERVKGSGWFESKAVPWEDGSALFDAEFNLTLP